MAKRTQCDKCVEKGKTTTPACIMYKDLIQRNHPMIEAIFILVKDCPYVKRAMEKTTIMAAIVAIKIKGEVKQ